MDIIEYIKELILKNQDVIIPGFGGFISEYESATFDINENVFLPPTIKIQFKPDYSFPDDTLIKLISRKETTSESEASKKLEVFISGIKTRLNKNEIIHLSGVGSLKKTNKGIIVFTQNKKINLLADAYGLKSIETKTAPSKSKEISESPKAASKKSLRRIVTLAISLCIIIVLISLSWYLSNGFTNFNFLSLIKSENTMLSAPEIDAVKSEAYLDSISKADSIKANINSTIDVATNKKEALFYTEQKNTIEEPKTQFSKFFIIAGSFKSSNNAQNFCDELKNKGFTPEIVETDNSIYRVALRSFSSESKALKELYSLRENPEIKQVWILKSN